jgi:hypothetical protein
MVMLMALVTSGIGARRMAHVFKPTVVDFLDIATMDNHLGLIIEEAVVGFQYPLILRPRFKSILA